MSTRARIATVCQGGSTHASVEQNREHVMRLLDLALRQQPDLVCLPETFTTPSVPIVNSIEELAETVPGPTTDIVARKAREHRCYIICPIVTRRDGAAWNSAVIVDRSGGILGRYDKVHPVTSTFDYTAFESGITPAGDYPVFDLDFGRVGIQICFDTGFPEGWAELARKGARMVFWPSAYNGGFPLRVYAAMHHYYVVSAVRPDRSRIIDPCGVVLAETDRTLSVIWRDVNLDFCVSNYDFNRSIPDRIAETYPGRVEIRSHVDDNHFLVEPSDDTLTIDQLKREFGFESASRYYQRHRDASARIQRGEAPEPQPAAHGDRPQYAKWHTE